MKIFFISVIYFKIFGVFLFAEDFSLICRELNNDEKLMLGYAGLECSLFSKKNNKKAGEIIVSDRYDKKMLFIDWIKIEEIYRKHGLSNVLLYHAIDTARKFFDFTYLGLRDDSSITKESKESHYKRYGFKELGDKFFEMNAEDFLNNPLNVERYNRRYLNDTIEFLN